jgi:hypothetical protein
MSLTRTKTDSLHPEAEADAAASPGLTAALDRIGFGRVQAALILLLMAGLFFDSLEQNSTGAMGPLLKESFGIGNAELTMINTATVLGGLAGRLIGGYIADRWGRRAALSLNLLVYTLGGLISAAALAAWGVSSSAQGASRSLGSGVVVIESNLAYQGGQGAGTGMVLTSSGNILTNNHVIAGATTIRVVVPGTDRSYSAKVVGYSVTDDVALIQASDRPQVREELLRSTGRNVVQPIASRLTGDQAFPDSRPSTISSGVTSSAVASSATVGERPND